MITVKVTRLLLDTGKIQRAVDRAKRRALFRAGGLIRTIAKRSMRKRKGPSKPGQPPHRHEGSLRRLIRFDVDPNLDEVLVGPIKRGNLAAPHSLEFGGPGTVVVKKRDGSRVRVAATFQARPFMAPALEKARPKLPPMWAGSVKG